MKKWLVAILVLALALVNTAMAENKALGKWGQKTVFSVSYDEKRFDIDTEEFRSDDTLTTRYQFALYDDFCFVSCFIDYYDWMRDFSSYLAGEAEMQLYIEDTLAAYSGVRTELTEIYDVTVSKDSQKASLPFVILRMADGGDIFYQAELVTHGYCIVFTCSTTGGSYPEEKLLRTLKGILDTFTPISE